MLSNEFDRVMDVTDPVQELTYTHTPYNVGTTEDASAFADLIPQLIPG